MYENIKVNKLEKSKVEITGAVKAKEFSSFRKKALENINNEITIDGFRKGKIPENVLISKVGEMTILEEMAELALGKAYPEIVLNEKIDAIGRPEIQITKIALDNPLEFKIIMTTLPKVKLGNYKKIAKEEMSKADPEPTVTDAEVDDAVKRIMESHGNHYGHNHGSPEEKEKIKAYILEDKKLQSREKKRIAISDKIIETSEIDIPDLLVNTELRRIEAQFTDDITRMGVKLEDYLKHAKKTIEEIRTEWRPNAEKKARLQLILNEIAKDEKIKVTSEEIDAEVKHILEHYKDADADQAYIYAETVLTNEKIYQFLEDQK